MQIVYTAENSIQAALVEGLIEGQGIQAWVSGGHLQGLMGASAGGVVKISVRDRDVAAARRIIAEFEAGERSA